MGSSQSSAQKDANRQIAEAVSVQKGAQEQFLNDPMFDVVRSFAQQIVDQPQTFGPEQRQMLFDQQADLARRSANEFLNNAAERSTVTSGFRSGDQEQARLLAAAGLGEGLAAAQRQVELMGAQQDRADLVNASGAAQNFLQLQQGAADRVSNAHLGAAQLFTQAPPEQAGPLGFFGGLAGNALGADPKLFGK